MYVMRLTWKDLKKEELTKYQSMNGWKEYPLLVSMRHGPINYIFWDIPGQEKVGELKHTHYTGVHGAIIMVDITNWMTKWSFPRLYKVVVDYCMKKEIETIHCVLVANKISREMTRKYMMMILRM
jgi:GTPase SAR1 family protein